MAFLIFSKCRSMKSNSCPTKLCRFPVYYNSRLIMRQIPSCWCRRIKWDSISLTLHKNRALRQVIHTIVHRIFVSSFVRGLELYFLWVDIFVVNLCYTEFTIVIFHFVVYLHSRFHNHKNNDIIISLCYTVYQQWKQLLTLLWMKFENHQPRPTW